MARAPKQQATPVPEESGADFVLERNFGWIEGGRHRFEPAGREFSLPDDARLISTLHRLGAPLRAR